MDIRLDGSSAYRTATCVLAPNESVLVESGAMSMMSDGLEVSASSGGGVLKGMWRKAAGGEKFLMTRYTSKWNGAWVQVAPRFPGDVIALDTSPGWLIQSGSFLAMDDGVELSTKVTGVKSALMKEGVTMLGLSGPGVAVVCAYGALQRLDLPAGTSVTVDTGHLVGWSTGVSTRTGLLGSMASAALSGEMLVTKCTGPGTILVQSRAEQALKSWLLPERAPDTGRV